MSLQENMYQMMAPLCEFISEIFVCTDGKMLFPRRGKCDGHVSCLDGSDENNDECQRGKFHMLLI